MLARTLKSTARIALHSLGIVGAVRASKRRGCRILVYHRFSEDRSYLIEQCEHIRRYYQPVSMRRVAESLATGTVLPNNAIAVTVDDGYRDFLVHAQPVFSTYEIPATVFLVTDFLDGISWLWWDQVEYLFDHTPCILIELAGRKFDIRSDLKRAAYKVSEELKRLRNAERLARLNMLQRQLGVELPERPPAEYVSLAWHEVRKLAAEGVEFGCHTRSHPILSSISSPSELHEEISGSKQRLDEELGRPTLHFCYPNGTWADFNEQTVAVIRSCRFASAATAESGFNYEGTDPFRLVRLGIGSAFPQRRFVELLAGLRKY
jgi:peptidoglycan/xylan/chitin deacetylase (PgdA/CDA1 family)